MQDVLEEIQGPASRRQSRLVHNVLRMEICEKDPPASIRDEKRLIQSVQEAGHQLEGGLLVRGFCRGDALGQVRLLTRNSHPYNTLKIPVPRLKS